MLDGKYVIPGLINVHGHVSGQWAPEGVSGEVEQFHFVFLVGDPGYGADLGKAELTRGKRCGDLR